VVAAGERAASVASSAGLMLAPLPNGLAVSVLGEAVTGRDGYGNDVRTETATLVYGCASWPLTTVEDDQGRTLVTSGRALLLPDGVAISATSKVRFDDGSTWRVQGDPEQHQSALTGARGGILVTLQKVTG